MVAGMGGDSEKAMTEEAEHGQKEREPLRSDYESNYERKTCLLGKSSGRGEASCHTHRGSKGKREATQDLEVPGTGLRSYPS